MKKVVFLPYDMDTAIGINNEGSLTFSYNLEDIDQISGGSDVYNGQNSVLWVNLRNAFYEELRAMYKELRSQGIISYDVVEQMFEEHQNKWPEAIFNEDAYFKYLQPLINEGSGAYLSMLQGSKSEQRKWWLYNRFKYIDSKYNAGDALTDYIQLRGYAKDNITITPYADVYPSIKFGSYLVQDRGERNVPTTIICPLDNLNDTEIYIYSASQLSSIGDISGLKVGFADFSMATKLRNLKIGDSSQSYTNGNLTALTLGNNVLLQTLDVRNCPNLTQSIDLSGCSNIEEVYFDGTAITGCSFPNGGILRTVSLPSTIANLTIRNQPYLTYLHMPDYSNITTLRLENVGSGVPVGEILDDISPNSRVRLIGFTVEMDNMDEVDALCDHLDTMRGLDEQGGNIDAPPVVGTITGLDYTQDTWIDEVHERYSGLNIEADLMLDTLDASNNGVYTAEEGHAYAPVNVNVPVIGPDEIAMGDPGGDIILHTQSTANNSFRNRNIESVYSDTITTTGADTFYGCANLKSVKFPNAINIGIETFMNCSNLEEVYLPNVTTIGYKQFQNCTKLKNLDLPKVTTISGGPGTTSFQNSGLVTISIPSMTSLGSHVFYGAANLVSINMPNVVSITGSYTFYGTKLPSFHSDVVSASSSQNLEYTFTNCKQLVTVVMPKYNTRINSNVFSGCNKLEAIDFGNISGIRCGSSVNQFANCTVLSTIVLRNNAVVPMIDFVTASFVNTPFASSGTGGTLYVPRDLIEEYQAATNWSTILGYDNNQIKAIEGSEYEHYYVDGTPIEEEE